MQDDRISNFEVSIPDALLEDLGCRLRGTRWPSEELVNDWSQGVPRDYLRQLTTHWTEGYDWRERERALNEWPHFTTMIDDHCIHFIHVKSVHDDARPLILTHGWPSSFMEFLPVLRELTNPTRIHGSAQAFHVVIPSLPGFGFSSAPKKVGVGVPSICWMWNTLMLRLGYERYLAHGGDWGASITQAIGVAFPETCAGLHTTIPLVEPDKSTLANLSDHEVKMLAEQEHFNRWESGYLIQQSSRPQTIGYALADSPVGQLAWIAEKFHAWTDCRIDTHTDAVFGPDCALDRDQLLDIASLYWLTNSGATSARLYWESYGSAKNNEPIMIPVGCSIFPKEVLRVSRRWAESRFKNLVYWNEPSRGGHFPALEVPHIFVDELRKCFASIH